MASASMELPACFICTMALERRLNVSPSHELIGLANRGLVAFLEDTMSTLGLMSTRRLSFT